MPGVRTRDWGLRKTLAPSTQHLAPALKISGGFLEDRERLIYLAEVAKRSQCRPSQLLELRGMPAYRLDCAAAEAQARKEREPVEDGNVMEW